MLGPMTAVAGAPRRRRSAHGSLLAPHRVPGRPHGDGGGHHTVAHLRRPSPHRRRARPGNLDGRCGVAPPGTAPALSAGTTGTAEPLLPEVRLPPSSGLMPQPQPPVSPLRRTADRRGDVNQPEGEGRVPWGLAWWGDVRHARAGTRIRGVMPMVKVVWLLPQPTGSDQTAEVSSVSSARSVPVRAGEIGPIRRGSSPSQCTNSLLLSVEPAPVTPETEPTEPLPNRP